jgi:hypothetical protein
MVLSICDPAGIRTQDPILKRDVLYLLSYWIGRHLWLALFDLFSRVSFKELQI